MSLAIHRARQKFDLFRKEVETSFVEEVKEHLRSLNERYHNHTFSTGQSMGVNFLFVKPSLFGEDYFTEMDFPDSEGNFHPTYPFPKFMEEKAVKIFELYQVAEDVFKQYLGDVEF